ncbi:MAG: GNAT family N-acetyltransferase, partial [Myxococcales bacterium]
MTAAGLRVVEFDAAGQPELLRRCQRLRYEVYHHDLGLDMDDLDHARRLDVEGRDGVGDFAAVVDADDRVLGCIRMQPPGRGPY